MLQLQRRCTRVVRIATMMDYRSQHHSHHLAAVARLPGSPSSSSSMIGRRAVVGPVGRFASNARRHDQQHKQRLRRASTEIGIVADMSTSSTSSSSHPPLKAASGRPAVSEAQRRSARLELDRMTTSTNRLLSLPRHITCDDGVAKTKTTKTTTKKITDHASVNEARVALRYWSRRWYMHFHPGFGRAAKGEAIAIADELRSKRWDVDVDANANVDANDDYSRRRSTVGVGVGVGVGEGVYDNADHDDDDDDDRDDHEVVHVTMEDLAGGDYGARQAERLLDWAISMDLVRMGIFDSEASLNDPMSSSPNSTCVNIMETYLLPMAYGGAGGASYGALGSAASTDDAMDVVDSFDDPGRDRHHHRTGGGDDNRVTLAKRRGIDTAHFRAVADATRVMKKMRRLHVEYPKHIYPDSLSVKAELNILSKRAMLLGDGRRGDTLDHAGTGANAGEVLGTDGIITGDAIVGNPREMLRQLERQNGSADAGDDQCDEGDIDFPYTSRGCIERMESILADAEARYVSTMDESMRPCSDWYNHVLGAWARSDDVPTASRRTLEILRGMEAHADDIAVATRGDGDKNRRRTQYLASPDTVSYNICLYCLARGGNEDASSGRDGARDVESMFRNLEERHRRTRDPTIRPDGVTYGVVLHALARAGLAREAEKILDTLEDEQQRQRKHDGTTAPAVLVPSLTIYNTVLNAWANCRRRDSPIRAESLLERMRILSSTGRNPRVEPDSISVSTVISCHARSKTRRGAERGERMLDEAIDMYSKGNSRVKPDSIMFNCAIMGWTNISGIEAEQRGASRKDIPAERAEVILKKMKDSRLDIQPGAYTYNHILDCWAKSEIKGCAERAVKLFRELRDPDEFSYNTLLHCFSKESDQWASYADDILQEMKDKKISIGQVTYHGMMNIHAKNSSKDGAKKAEIFLRGMESEGLSPGEMSYNICIDAYARRGDHRKAQSLLEEMISLSDNGNVECRPSIHSFAAVVNALAKSGDANAVARAEEVVRRVEGLDYVTPNTILYNSLIDCMVKSRRKDNSLQAEDILLRMEQMYRSGNNNVRPNSYAYSMVLTCCARSKEKGSAERAERILLNMESLFSEGLSDVIANSRCYSAAITAWARSNSPDAVERTFALIDRMERNGREGSPHGKPNAHCYNACIHAIAKSQLPGKARRCQEVLNRMAEAVENGFHESAPSYITYSTIINACAFTSGDEDEKRGAFDLARFCFLTLLESTDMEPCASSFTNFFLVINKHLKQGAIRDQLSHAVFIEGCRRGKMNKQALDSFRKASSVSDRILSEYKVFPPEWRRSIADDGCKYL